MDRRDKKEKNRQGNVSSIVYFMKLHNTHCDCALKTKRWCQLFLYAEQEWVADIYTVLSFSAVNPSAACM